MRCHGVRPSVVPRVASVYLTALLCWTVPQAPASDRYAAVWIDELQIVEVYATPSFGLLVRGRRVGHEAEMLLRKGDRLADGKVAWIGFLSESLAVVRLKQRVWPPDGKEPYREILRVLGWAGDDPLSAAPEVPAPRSLLLAAGREGVGFWPRGRYSNPRHRLAEHVAGERLPRVDLFAAFFREKYGLLPWEHEAWNEAGWTVEEGFPTHGSIVGFREPPSSFERFAASDSASVSGDDRYDPGSRRDPFRSLLTPWTLQGGFVPPTGIHGLLIDELELAEVYWTPAGPLAKVRCRHSSRSWILRPGDELWDGDVVSIDPDGLAWYSRCGEVTFKQVVLDTTALKPFQLVVRRLSWRRGDCF